MKMNTYREICLKLTFFILSFTRNADTCTATLPDFPNPRNGAYDSLNITETDDLDTLLSIDATKASGLNSISAELLKEAAPAIAPHLKKLFNLSLEKKGFLAIWKEIMSILCITKVLKICAIVTGLFPYSAVLAKSLGK